jgi:hypothetical protein
VKRRLPIAALFAAITALLLAACGSEDEGSKSDGGIAGADAKDSTVPASPSESSGGVDRPEMTFPDDVKKTLEGWKIRDVTEDAVLTNTGRAQAADTQGARSARHELLPDRWAATAPGW